MRAGTRTPVRCQVSKVAAAIRASARPRARRFAISPLSGIAAQPSGRVQADECDEDRPAAREEEGESGGRERIRLVAGGQGKKLARPRTRRRPAIAAAARNPGGNSKSISADTLTLRSDRAQGCSHFGDEAVSEAQRTTKAPPTSAAEESRSPTEASRMRRGSASPGRWRCP